MTITRLKRSLFVSYFSQHPRLWIYLTYRLSCNPVGNPNKPDEGLFGGYPQCFSVWYPEDITDVALQPGDWFVQDPRGNYTESWCNANAIKPLLILPPHSAPLDLKFGVRPDDTNLYVPLHGSSARSTTLVSLATSLPMALFVLIA